MTDTASAVVIGGGIVGASIAHFLAKKGLKGVVLLERDTVGSGATGKSGALVRMHYTNPWDAALAIKSLEVFSNWDDLIGGDGGFRKTGFLFVVGHHDKEKLVKNVDMLQKLGVNTRVISPEEVKVLQPFCSAEDIGAAAYEPDSGYGDGYSAATGMARRARELGARVQQGVKAVSILTRSDKVVGVETTQGVIDTPVAVIAAGAWSAQLARTAGVDLPVVGVQHTAGVLERPPALAQPHMAFIDRSIGTYFRPDVGALTHVGIRPPQRTGTIEVDPDNFDANIPTEWKVYTALRLIRRVPAMADALWRRAWTGVDGHSPDGHMILDKAPGIVGLYIAAGMSGTGFKTGPAVGLAMAELVLEGQAKSVDIHAFRLGRFAEGKPIVAQHEYVVPPFKAVGV
ncbi:MAG: FAD-binding oxidoreductase [Chloroflexi bacterium]|nr:FAD-binding oxidoreductase [Chloroflexota bacterium]